MALFAGNLNRSYNDTSRGDRSEKVALQITLCVLVVLFAVIGNGLLIFLFCRHKTLQKMPIFLIVDLSLIDLLSSAIKIPLFICYYVLDIPSSRGKAFAWIVFSLNALFTLLPLATMAVQMADRYLAVCWPAFYKANKTKTKLFVIILVKWILNILITLLAHISIYKIDLGNASVSSYTEFYFQDNGLLLTRLTALGYFLLIVILACLILRTLRQHSQQMAAAGQNGNSPSERQRRKAIYTIIIVTVLCIVSYLPGLIIMMVNTLAEQGHKLNFVIFISVSIPSAINPFLFLWRVDHFKQKVKKLKSALCGQSAQYEIHNFPGQNSIEKICGKQYKRTNTPLVGRRASLPESSTPRQTAKTRRHSF